MCKSTDQIILKDNEAISPLSFEISALFRAGSGATGSGPVANAAEANAPKPSFRKPTHGRKTIKMFTVEQIKFDSESNSSEGQQFVEEESQGALGVQAVPGPINVVEQNEDYDSYEVDSGKNNYTYEK